MASPSLLQISFELLIPAMLFSKVCKLRCGCLLAQPGVQAVPLNSSLTKCATAHRSPRMRRWPPPCPPCQTPPCCWALLPWRCCRLASVLCAACSSPRCWASHQPSWSSSSGWTEAAAAGGGAAHRKRHPQLRPAWRQRPERRWLPGRCGQSSRCRPQVACWVPWSVMVWQLALPKKELGE